MKKISIETSCFYAKPSFIGGMAKIMNLRGALPIYNSFLSKKADDRAVRSDWMRVGKDLAYSIEKYGQK